MTVAVRCFPSNSTVNVEPAVEKSLSGNPNAITVLSCGEKVALLIQPTTNSANFIVYFVNPTDQTFRRATSTPGTAVVLAESITNSLVFQAQDFTGITLTNRQNNRVIHVTLEFYQPKRHRQIADYYKLETSVTRRTLE